MLTEANLKEHLLKAYFVDENRTLIEVLYSSLDFKETLSAIIEYDLKHPDCQALLKVMSLDDLHESTYNQKKKNVNYLNKKQLKLAKIVV